MRNSFTIAGIVLIPVLLSGSNAIAQQTDQTTSREASAMQQLQRFKQTNALPDLDAAITAMQATTDSTGLTPRNFVADRRTIITGWAQVLKAIEGAYDPTFHPGNAADLPETCVTPPRENSGRQLPPCADPKDVQDPQARATYLAALKANTLKLQRVNRYQAIDNLDDRAMSVLKNSLDYFRKIAPGGVGADYAALDAILRTAGVSETRRLRIDAMFYPRSNP